MDAKTFGAFVAKCRRKMGMTQAGLAAKLNVTDKAVSRWERGVGFPDIGTIEFLASALNVSVLELMKSESDNVFYPHRIELTESGMDKLPVVMQKLVQGGGRLFIMREPEDGQAWVSVNMKQNAAMCAFVDVYDIVATDIVSTVTLSMPEPYKRHLLEGGKIILTM